MANATDAEALKTPVEELTQRVDALRLKLNLQADRIRELDGDTDHADTVPGDLESLLPTDRWAVARRAGESLSANIERASYGWEAFESCAHHDRGDSG